MKHNIILLIALCVISFCVLTPYSDATKLDYNISVVALDYNISVVAGGGGGYGYSLNYTPSNWNITPNYSYNWTWNSPGNYSYSNYTNITHVDVFTYSNEINRSALPFTTTPNGSSINQSINQTIVLQPVEVFGLLFGLFNGQYPWFTIMLCGTLFALFLMTHRSSSFILVGVSIITISYLWFEQTGWILNVFVMGCFTLWFMYDILGRDWFKKDSLEDADVIKEFQQKLSDARKPEIKQICEKPLLNPIVQIKQEPKQTEPYILDVSGSYIKEL